jgi:hypothetical protein
MLGAYLCAGQRRFPIRLDVVIEPRSNDVSHVVATFTSTEGWYIGRAPAFGRLFNQRCDEIVTGLQSGSIGSPVQRPRWRPFVIVGVVMVIIAALVAAYLTYPSSK